MGQIRKGADRGARAGLLVVTALLAGCVHGPPNVAGVPGAPPTPHDLWTPPPGAMPAPARAAKSGGKPGGAAAAPALPPELASRIRQLQVTDIVDLALRNNPATRVSWAQARAAADAYGVQRGKWLPTLDATVTGTQSQTLSSTTRFGGRRRQIGTSVTLSYLLLDLGGRAGATDAARDAAIAAGLTHNSVVQAVVLQAENAYFGYMSNRALVQAQESSLKEAQTNLKAAENRHDVGLATIADVLQARTAQSQAQLALETAQGTLRTAQGELAVAMGLPANVQYDVAPAPAQVKVQSVAESVDSLIAAAVRSRPDLAAAEAQARSARASVSAVRSQLYPSLSLSANGGRLYSDISQFSGDNYTISLGLSIPLFSGLSRVYATQQAEAQAKAAAAQAEGVRQQVIQQVFTSYYALQTATQRARTSDDLLASATQSEQVAAGRYREGVGSILDLLTAQSALASARAQQAQARWAWYSALAQLSHDVGVLGPEGQTPIPLSPDTHDH